MCTFDAVGLSDAELGQFRNRLHGQIDGIARRLDAGHGFFLLGVFDVVRIDLEQSVAGKQTAPDRTGLGEQNCVTSLPRDTKPNRTGYPVVAFCIN